MIKVIIAGGRNFDDYPKLCQVCDEFLQDQNNIEMRAAPTKAPTFWEKSTQLHETTK